MPARKQNCVWLYLKINKSTCINQKLARMPCEMLITWKRYAGHIVARMKQHHKCMGRTALGCTAWGCTAWGCTAWGCTAWGCTAWICTAHGVALHGAALHGTALHGVALHGVALHGAALHETALHIGYVALHGVALHGAAMHGVALHGTPLHGAALHRLHCISCMFFCLGGGEAIPLSLGRACLIKPRFIIAVINADCRITKS